MFSVFWHVHNELKAKAQTVVFHVVFHIQLCYCCKISNQSNTQHLALTG